MSSASPTGLARSAVAGAVAVGIVLCATATATGLVLTGAGDDGSTAGPLGPPAAAAATPSSSPAAVVAPAATPKAPSGPGAISALAANGIPKVALNAYRVAAARVNHADASCHLHWSLLAGLGRAESDHGRLHGAKLRTNGLSTPPNVGPALDGKPYRSIAADPAYVAVTGDRRYAHALGPMQFIPSTWRTYGSDANGDGTRDVFDIDDAALGAARYLCAAGDDLSTRAARMKALLAYNHSDAYVAQVLALADRYRGHVTVTGRPDGDVTGSLPEVHHRGSLPPVNPAPPTASSGDPRTRATPPKAPASTPKPSSSPTKTGSSAPHSGGSSSGSPSGGTSSSTSGGSSPTDTTTAPSEDPETPSDTPTSDDPETPTEHPSNPAEDPTTPADPGDPDPLCDAVGGPIDGVCPTG